MGQRICSVPDCESPTVARGYCGKHYQRFLKHGDPTISKARPREDLLTRLERHVVKSDAGCWGWVGAHHPGGYGNLTYDNGEGHKRPHAAHRLAYELYVGPIPDGHVIDHICHNAPCCNPAHLRPCTQAENLENRRGAHGASGIRGVREAKPGRWFAYCRKDGIRYSAGYHDTPEQAERAAIALRLRIFTHNDLDRVEAAHAVDG